MVTVRQQLYNSSEACQKISFIGFKKLFLGILVVVHSLCLLRTYTFSSVHRTCLGDYAHHL